MQVLLAQAKNAIELYADPSHRADYRDRLAALASRLLADAAPGSDHQLSFARAFAAAARTPEHAAVVRSWLSGDAPDGLAIDTDLRWTLLQRLIALGAADEAEIDAELESDDTATGLRQAAQARAAIPTAEAKERAYAAVMATEDELPNALLTATIGGFVQPDQRDLHRAFLTRYFDSLPAVWEQRTNETAQSITMGFYPTLLVEPETIALTDDVPRARRRAVRCAPTRAGGARRRRALAALPAQGRLTGT